MALMASLFKLIIPKKKKISLIFINSTSSNMVSNIFMEKISSSEIY